MQSAFSFLGPTDVLAAAWITALHAVHAHHQPLSAKLKQSVNTIFIASPSTRHSISAWLRTVNAQRSSSN